MSALQCTCPHRPRAKSSSGAVPVGCQEISASHQFLACTSTAPFFSPGSPRKPFTLHKFNRNGSFTEVTEDPTAPTSEAFKTVFDTLKGYSRRQLDYSSLPVANKKKTQDDMPRGLKHGGMVRNHAKAESGELILSGRQKKMYDRESNSAKPTPRKAWVGFKAVRARQLEVKLRRDLSRMNALLESMN